MNKDSDKTKEQLLAELDNLRKKSKEKEDKLKAANRQLENENKRFLLTMDTIDAGVYVSDMQTHELIFLNKYLTDLVGEKQAKNVIRLYRT
ncbi:hypothetical protein [Flexistipes sinusarabici]|uniref:hypothetical protein n=1 Tax=Flexistipes sinusarabici TaxID=2352 RepID=UPI000316DC6F|nr:hypothetical protein [Flexistipes sinusarabici]